MKPAALPLVAVDIGNSRVKLGLFDELPHEDFPVPRAAIGLTADWKPDEIENWLENQPVLQSWRIASVNRAGAARLVRWLETRHAESVKLLRAADLPLEVAVPAPDAVGVDRLVNAVAANRLRQPDRPAIVVDVGTAITVDLISESGAFCGGSILPGIATSARALHEFTDLLPLSEMVELAGPPSPLGTSTIDALKSGLFWGAVGGVSELIVRLSSGLAPPQVFLTGGAAPSVAALLRLPDGHGAQYVPHLTLGGIALSAVR